MSGDDMTLPVLHDRTSVRVNWSRWISDCTTCANAWAVDESVILWMCRDCWTVVRPVWPPDPIAIEWLLIQRPDPITRNWAPGETLADLLIENAAHGLIPDWMHDLSGDGSDVLSELDGRIVSGAVMSRIERYRELAGSRPALTGGN